MTSSCSLARLGRLTSADQAAYHNATWIWDGAVWAKVDAPGPTDLNLIIVGMATVGKEVIVLTAFPYDHAPPDAVLETWSFDGSTWKRLDIKSPPWRLAPAMASW